MELIDRYLQAVRFWLPKEKQEDIIAELSEDLRSQIEERETELGRELDESEVEEILKQRGRPVLVATRYRPQQYLIGPTLFPIYCFVLKIVALGYLLHWIIMRIFFLSFTPAYRAEHSRWTASLLSAGSAIWVTALISVGAVTIVFAIVEQSQLTSRILEDWSPSDLPPARTLNQIHRSASLIELVVNYVFGTWLIFHMSSRIFLDHPDLKITLSPAWSYFFWGFLLLAVLNLALAYANLMRPYWTSRRAMFRLLCDCIGSALFCWLLQAGIVSEITVPHASTARMLEITGAINLWMAKAFPVCVVVGLVIAATDIHRIFRATTKPTSFGPAMTTGLV